MGIYKRKILRKKKEKTRFRPRKKVRNQDLDRAIVQEKASLKIYLLQIPTSGSCTSIPYLLTIENLRKLHQKSANIFWQVRGMCDTECESN